MKAAYEWRINVTRLALLLTLLSTTAMAQGLTIRSPQDFESFPMCSAIYTAEGKRLTYFGLRYGHIIATDENAQDVYIPLGTLMGARIVHPKDEPGPALCIVE